MANRSFEMYQYRQVLLRMRQGDSDRAIARAGLMGRTKAKDVRKIAEKQGWLSAEDPPDDEELAVFFHRPKSTTQASISPLAQHRGLVETWVNSGLQATTIYGLLKRKHKYTGSYSSVRRFVRRVVPKVPEATMPMHFSPGEAAQVDFGTGPMLQDPVSGEETKTWIFVMTLCWSRHQYAEIVWDQKVPTWLGCHQRAFRFFGGLPERIVLDNAKCAIVRACAKEPEVQRAYYELAEAYGFKLDVCPPRSPKLKGRVEAGVKYVKRSFLPGREFRDLADANRQLEAWVVEEAGNRIHGTTRERPLTRFAETEKEMLQAIPSPAYEPAEWKKLKLHKDCHVRFEHCRYSAPWIHIDESLWVRITATMVQIYREHTMVATHTRCSKAGECRTVIDHLPPEAQAHLLRTPAWCREQADEVGPGCRQVVDLLLADRVVERLPAAKSLISLGKSYGAPRLESACRRALAFDDPRYRTVKTILHRGLDQVAVAEEAFDRLSDTYTGSGRFSRDTKDLLSH